MPRRAALLALALAAAPLPAADDPAAVARLEQFVAAKKGTVERDADAPGRPVVNVILVGAKLKDADLEPLAGVTTLRAVSLGYNPDLTDAGLAVLLKSPGLESLTLVGTGLTDAGLKRLTTLKKVKRLLLENTKVTDAGLTHLTAFPDLADLGLGATAVTDFGMPGLVALKNLKVLSVFNTAVTDAGVRRLVPLRGLRSLNVGKTKVTAVGLSVFREANPGCAVTGP